MKRNLFFTLGEGLGGFGRWKKGQERRERKNHLPPASDNVKTKRTKAGEEE